MMVQVVQVVGQQKAQRARFIGRDGATSCQLFVWNIANQQGQVRVEEAPKHHQVMPVAVLVAATTDPLFLFVFWKDQGLGPLPSNESLMIVASRVNHVPYNLGD